MKNSDKWIFKHEKKLDAVCRIFCFHHAGGTVALYRGWETCFGEKMEVCLVQLPMRANRMDEKMPNSIEELVSKFIEDCSDLFDLPFLLFGHSMGAKVAYETAYQLSLKNIYPMGLFVSACEAPVKNDKTLAYESALNVHEDVLLDILRSYDHMLENDVLENPEFLEYYLPIVRRDFFLSDTYKKKPNKVLKCDINVFVGKQDAHINYNTCLEWKHYTEGDCAITTFVGDHFYLENKENIKKIKECIDKKVNVFISIMERKQSYG